MKRRLVLAAIFAGPLAWFGQLFVGWLAAEGSCQPGSSARLVSLAISAPAFAIACGAFAVGLAARRHCADPALWRERAATDAFLAEVALLSAGGSAIGIVANLAGILAAPLCGAMR